MSSSCCAILTNRTQSMCDYVIKSHGCIINNIADNTFEDNNNVRATSNRAVRTRQNEQYANSKKIIRNRLLEASRETKTCFPTFIVRRLVSRRKRKKKTKKREKRTAAYKYTSIRSRRRLLDSRLIDTFAYWTRTG